MNKQELKSLLENIYHLLAEAPLNEYQSDPNFVGPPAPALYIPPYGFPVVPITTPTNPVATPPVATPVPTVPNERIRPQPLFVDDPALLAEIQRIRAEIKRIRRLENQEGLEALQAQLQALIAELLRQRQLQRDARKPFWI